jgi:type I restriction enzyme S subunit
MQDLKEHIATKSSLRNIEGDLLPELRFKGFDEEWKETLLDNIAEFRKGKGISKSDIFDDGTLECIRYGELYTTYNELIVNVVSKTNLPLKGLELSEYNDVIIPASGETQLDIATASCVLKSGVALSGDLNIIRSSLNGIFLSFYLNNKKKLEIAKLAQGSSVVHLYSSQLKSLKLNIPSLPEQQKIASFLSAVDEKIQQLTRKKGLLEQYKKGVMQQLFSGKLRFKDDTSTELSARNGKSFPDWEVKRLGDVAIIAMGQSPDSKSYNIDSKGMLLIQGNADIKDRITIPRQWTSEPTKTCEIGDLILTVRAPVGSVAKSLHNACIGRGVCSITNTKNSFQEYLYQFFLSYESKWIGLEQGSTFTAVSGSDIKGLKLNLPSLPEQQKIANFLSSLDFKIESTTQQITQTQTFKKGLLQKMFV